MNRAILALAVLGMVVIESRASAQSVYTRNRMNAISQGNSASGYTTNRVRRQVYRQAVPQYQYNTLNQNLFRSQLTGRSLQGSPSRSPVSPYMGLSQPFSSTGEQYYTQIRPRQDQQRFNQQMAARNAQMQHQLNSMAAQAPYQVEGSEEMAPTGHTAAFMNTGGYYPTADARR
jgi:hypothetical protein